MALVQAITIYINWLGFGMDAYSSSFSTYLIKSTLGNFNGNKMSDYDDYILAIIPAVNYLILFAFYLFWKKHYIGVIRDQEEDNADVKP